MVRDTMCKCCNKEWMTGSRLRRHMTAKARENERMKLRIPKAPVECPHCKGIWESQVAFGHHTFCNKKLNQLKDDVEDHFNIVKKKWPQIFKELKSAIANDNTGDKALSVLRQHYEEYFTEQLLASLREAQEKKLKKAEEKKVMNATS